MNIRLIFFAALLSLSSALFDTECGPYNVTTFSRLSAPPRRAFAAWHRLGESWDYSKGDLRIQTWPQYGTLADDGILSARVSGYAYTLPTNTTTESLQEEKNAMYWSFRYLLYIFKFIVPVHVLRPSHGGLSTIITDDILSYSVTGATISIDADSRVTTTNEYGHFDIEAQFRSLGQQNAQGYLEQMINLQCQDQPNRKVQVSLVPVMPVSRQGLTIISDIDDVLRHTKLWNLKAALDSFFLYDFIPVVNMPELFKNISSALPATTHFSYTTDGPELLSSAYVDGVLQYYPPGSFTFRPFKFDTILETFHPRLVNIERQLAAFPDRKFVLFGDTATPSIITAYSKLVKSHSEQILCVFVRDIQASEAGSRWIVSSTSLLDKKAHGRFRFYNSESIPELMRVTEVLKAISGGLLPNGCGENKEMGSLSWRTLTSQVGSWCIGSWWRLMCWGEPGSPCRFDR